MVPTGNYTLEASKEGYVSQTKTVTVGENQAINVNFRLSELEDGGEPSDEIREQIDAAIAAGNIGAILNIQQKNQYISYMESRYADISITPLNVDTLSGTISVLVDGNEPRGYTIVIDIDSSLFTLDEITVKYDDIPILEATDFEDILHYDDDGSLPEFWIKKGPLRTYIFCSLLGFSEHTITIYTLGEQLNVILQTLLYSVCCIIAIFLMFNRGIRSIIRRELYMRKKK